MSAFRVTVERQAAKQIFRDAIAIAQDRSIPLLTTQWDSAIATLIQGKHLTFRYILITALLAKATNPRINALALQAGADIEGAYDARSLCHTVVVPLERQLLNRALGGSNEPFLNKPARFPTVSPSNAVRAGTDRQLLLKLYEILSEIVTSEQAFNALCLATRYALEKQTALSQRASQLVISTNSQLKIIEFVEMLTARSLEGQIAAITMGAALAAHFDQFTGFEVIVHPVNQSGASSQEVGDIDIKREGQLFGTVEVKDKPFSEQDVDHAAFKASQYGLTSITFAIGANGQCIEASSQQIAQTVLTTRGVNVIFIEQVSFVKSAIALCPNLTFTTFWEKLRYYAINARVKDDVFTHMEAVLQAMQVLE